MFIDENWETETVYVTQHVSDQLWIKITRPMGEHRWIFWLPHFFLTFQGKQASASFKYCNNSNKI